MRWVRNSARSCSPTTPKSAGDLRVGDFIKTVYLSAIWNIPAGGSITFTARLESRTTIETLAYHHWPGTGNFFTTKPAEVYGRVRSAGTMLASSRPANTAAVPGTVQRRLGRYPVGQPDA